MPSVITPCGGGGGSGIQYDTHPQLGDWLWIETTDATTSPDGTAITLRDTSANAFGAAGIHLSTTQRYVLIEATDASAGDVSVYAQHFLGLTGINSVGIDSDGGIGIHGDVVTITGDSGVTLQGSGSVDISNDLVKLTSNTTDVTIVANTDLRVFVNSGSGGGFLTVANLPTTNPGGTDRVWRDSGTLKIT